MGIKRHKPEEIDAKLRQVEVLCGQGMPRIDVIGQLQKTEQTFYRLRKQRAFVRHWPEGNGERRREELKVPMKQPKKGRLWLNDG